MTAILFHFVITLQAPVSNGSAINTVTGTITLDEGATRTSAYAEVMKRATDALSPPFRKGDCVTLFFCLEPDELAAVRGGED